MNQGRRIRIPHQVPLYHGPTINIITHTELSVFFVNVRKQHNYFKNSLSFFNVHLEECLRQILPYTKNFITKMITISKKCVRDGYSLGKSYIDCILQNWYDKWNSYAIIMLSYTFPLHCNVLMCSTQTWKPFIVFYFQYNMI